MRVRISDRFSYTSDRDPFFQDFKFPMTKISNFCTTKKKTKVDIKIRFFFMRRMFSVCTLHSFRRLQRQPHTIDIDPPFQFVDFCRE